MLDVQMRSGEQIDRFSAQVDKELARVTTQLPSDLVIFGEIGLAGEIRPVQSGQERLREAGKHGFKRAIVPKANLPKNKSIPGMEVIGVQHLQEAIGQEY